jgi:hypothetical protein
VNRQAFFQGIQNIWWDQQAEVWRMTTETQTFISLGEIIGFRICCGTCKTQTVVSLATEESQKHARAEWCFCPHCNARWFEGTNDERLFSIQEFVRGLIGLRNQEIKMKSTAPSRTFELQIPGGQ